MESLLKPLPPPPPGKNGWPWTVEAPQPPEPLPNDYPWPRISIVTPTLNQGPYLEETIRSVLMQGYPNLEYIIMDGGSTDGTVEIIKRYEPWLAYWISEPDKGQSNAINKGFDRATGDLLGWLNSDDTLLPEALTRVAHVAVTQPVAEVFVGGTNHHFTWNKRTFQRYPQGLAFVDLIDWGSNWIPQPSCFWTMEAWNSCGPLDETLHIAMDMDLWLKMANRYRFAPIPQMLSTCLVHPAAKTQSRRALMYLEMGLLQMRHGREDLARRTLMPLADKCDALYPLHGGLYLERATSLYHFLMRLKKVPVAGSTLKFLRRILMNVNGRQDPAESKALGCGARID